MGVRLLPEEHAQLAASADREGMSPADLLRRAYFADDVDLARWLYEQNEFDRYGHSLGRWVDVEGEPRTHYARMADNLRAFMRVTGTPAPEGSDA